MAEGLSEDAAPRWLRGGDSGCCCADCCSVPLDEEQCERLLRGTGEVLDACGQRVESLDHCAHVLYTVVAENLDLRQGRSASVRTRASYLKAYDQEMVSL